MLAYYYSWSLIQTKTKFKCRVYNIKAGDKNLVLGTYINKTIISVTAVFILVKQSYNDKMKLFCETYSFHASFCLSFHSTF